MSGRLVAATWWLFGFIIIASYTANLAAFLTVSRLDTPVESLDDLAKQYKIQYAPLKNSASQTYFQRMNDIEDKFYTYVKYFFFFEVFGILHKSAETLCPSPIRTTGTVTFQ